MMKKGLLLYGILFLLISISPAKAQTRTDLPFTLPQTIFVGDLARLVVPLSDFFAGEEPFIIETPERLPLTPDLLIRRIELERRPGVLRLLIDFIPFATGNIPFPDIEFFSQYEEAPVITGLEVYVSSILSPNQMTLSEPAPPLAVPGTGFLVYGTIFLIILFLFLGIGGSVWGRRHFSEMLEMLRRKFLIFKMRRYIKNLKEESEEEENPAPYLSSLSGEFREFLSLFTGINCRSLSAAEFMELPLENQSLGPVFLSGLFQTWDTLRFSGRAMEPVDFSLAMAEIEDFLIALDRPEIEKGASE
ncbi:MAG: hypothetical protein FWG77_09845 [Treponema sp.]|nr:hypothetical protein [Treponema sp.]